LNDSNSLHEFGPFRLDERERRLTRGGSAILLSPKVFETLLLLVRNAGHLISKDAMMSALWPDTVVDESNLTKNIWMIRKALGESEEGGLYIETVPRAGYRFVTAVSPARLEIPAIAPPPEAPRTGPHPPAPTERGAGAWSRWAAAGVFTAVAAAAAILLRLAPSRSAAVAASVSRPSVVVVRFRDLSGRAENAWLAETFTDLLGTELGSREAFRTIPRAADAPGPGASVLSADELDRVRVRLGADLVVLGSYVVVGHKPAETIRLDVWLQRTRGGETLAAITETGTEDDLIRMISSATAKITERLGSPASEGASAAVMKASIPASSGAARLYAAGVEKLRQFDALAARELLTRAAAADPGYAMTHAALADAWSTLGYDARAKDEARLAYSLSTLLSREQHLAVEGRLRESEKDWNRASEIYGALYRFFPDDLDYGLKLVESCASSGRSREAAETLESLRRSVPLASRDPRVDLSEARAAETASDFRREIEAAGRAAESAQASGNRPLLAEALNCRGWAEDLIGRADLASADLDRSASLFTAVGDRAGDARARLRLAGIAYDVGNLSRARNIYETSLATFREIGQKSGEAAALSNLANVLWRQNELAQAEACVEQVLAIRRETGDQQGVAWALDAEGEILTSDGRLEDARKLLLQSEGLSREIGDLRDLSYGLDRQADLFRCEGRLPAARAKYDEALAVGRRAGDPAEICGRLQDLADLLTDLGDLPGARRALEEALALGRKNSSAGAESAARLTLAEVSLADGKTDDARSLSADALKGFVSEKDPAGQARARALLSRIELGLGDRESARRDADEAVRVASVLTRDPAAIAATIAWARVREAAGSNGDVREELERSLAGARRLRRTGNILELELELARLEPASRRRELLEQLAARARAKGFSLIARDAERSTRTS
jgi:DNA-binding winged helix-turn-helix (wHTH) protein/tetratricopeptide (TPR) repeat protein